MCFINTFDLTWGAAHNQYHWIQPNAVLQVCPDPSILAFQHKQLHGKYILFFHYCWERTHQAIGRVCRYLLHPSGQLQPLTSVLLWSLLFTLLLLSSSLPPPQHLHTPFSKPQDAIQFMDIQEVTLKLQKQKADHKCLLNSRTDTEL